MEHTLVRLSNDDGTWRQLTDQWGQQVADYGEDFSDYAADAMPMLRDLIAEPKNNAGVYALRTDDGRYEAVAQVNSTFLPGYQGKVLRIRHLLLAPRFDFEDYELLDYARVLGRMFSRMVGLAHTELPSRHVKFHMRSPADRLMMEQLQGPIREADIFKDVAIKGAWFYLSLREAEVAA